MLVKGMVLDACTISTTPATAVRAESANSGSSSTLRAFHTEFRVAWVEIRVRSGQHDTTSLRCGSVDQSTSLQKPA